MRRFLIYYWTEKNDEATDLEIIVKADDMEKALKEFKKEVKVYKSITTITELTYA
jgi:hypothetical protein